jgi:hypothetical protein
VSWLRPLKFFVAFALANAGISSMVCAFLLPSYREEHKDTVFGVFLILAIFFFVLAGGARADLR